MKKKAIILRCAKILCLVLCLALLSGLCADLCQYHDYNVRKLAGFYAEPKDSLDVVLLGASEVFTDFSSGHAYDLYGFTSYPYALDAAPATVHVSQLREIRKHQDPKWIVVEINGFLYDDPALQTNSGSLRRYLNNIPVSINWARTILEETPKDEWLYYFFPLAKDHSNWKTIPDQLEDVRELAAIRLGGSVLKGNVSTMNCYEGPDHRDVSADLTRLPLEPMARQELIGFLEYCREEKIENILFVRFPHVIATEESYERYCRGNEAGQIIQEYGYDFVNLEREYAQIGLIAAEDFYNEDHTNYRGQQKLTEYFGRILVEEYGVTESQLTNVQKQDWDKAADYSRRFYAYAEAQMAKGLTGTLMEDRETLALLDAQ